MIVLGDYGVSYGFWCICVEYLSQTFLQLSWVYRWLCAGKRSVRSVAQGVFELSNLVCNGGRDAFVHLVNFGLPKFPLKSQDPGGSLRKGTGIT